MVRDPSDKQQHHHWAPDTVMKAQYERLLLPQDCNQVVSGALICTLRARVLALSCTTDLKYKQLVLLVHSRTSAGPALWKDFCLHLPGSCTMDVTAITSALPQEED